MNQEELRNIVNSDVFIPLRDFIYNKCLELRDIENVKDCSVATSQALELKSQKKAYEKLEEILKQIMAWEAIANREVPDNSHNDFGI